jgi:hypothetical protein
VPGLGANGGGATQGTRFLIRFVDIPGGVGLLVPHRIQVAPSGVPGGYPIEVRRVFGADSSGFGGCYYLGCLTPPPPGTLGLVEDRKGTGVAVYEFIASTPYTGDVFDIPVLACRGKVSEYGECRQILPPALLPNLAVRASLAPVTTTPGWYSGAPIPRFVEVGIQTPLP